jgi:3-polyprenyl-4-hydroxybenzoate decarboxylase
MKPIIVARTEATGVIFGIRLPQVLGERSIEVRLVVSPQFKKTIALEAEYSVIF